jgi:NhaP-type Na+/H+ or K+/H+ antiporter
VSFLGWVAVAGALLLSMALASSVLRRMAVSTSIVYLAFGLAVGPAGLGWLTIDLVTHASWFERLAEVAVVVSLFMGGLKLRLPLRHAAWRPALLLAGPVMVVCIVGVTLVLRLVFGLPWDVALLLGAVLAPTDPVLASSLTVTDAADRDRLRYGLSGEAGLNDGAAFPFVALALSWHARGGPGDWLLPWALERILWAVPAGLAIGYVLGRAGGRLAIALRRRQQDHDAPNDFLALALIALCYVAAEVAHGWGFLAAFAAGVGMRRAEIDIVKRDPHPDHAQRSHERHPPAEHLLEGQAMEHDALETPYVAAGVVLRDILTFGDTAERLMEAMLVVLVGVALGTHWDSRGLIVAASLFFVLRPLAAGAALYFSETSAVQRALMAWLGIRGIGSLYYLCHALRLGIDAGYETSAADITLSVVGLSILLHGSSAQLLLARYETWLKGSR